MRKITYLLFLGVILLQGCSEFLENKPKGITIPSVFQDYQKLMASVYLTRMGNIYPMFLTDDVHLLFNVKTADSYNFANKSEVQRNAFSFKGGQLFTPGQSDGLWNGLYNQIFIYNTVINEVMSVPDASEKEKLRLRSEALVARAFQYYILVNAYARQYDNASADTDYGVPLILKADINQSVTRNTVAQVYKQIEDDLKDAFPNLRDKAAFATYPSKAAAYSFFARLYLGMGRYDEALSNAKLALGVKSNLYDHRPYVVTDVTTWGRIVGVNGGPFLYDIDNPECIYLRNVSEQISNTCCASVDLKNIFKKDLPADAVDMRRTLFYADDKVNYGGSPLVFPGETTFGPWINHNYGFTTSENMLITAECEARIGSKDKAMEYLNTLRDSRIKNNQPLAAVNNEDALVKVLDERRREFAFVGYHRLFDLKRLNKDDRFKKTITHNVEGVEVTLNPNDNKYILPVSTQVMDFNPSMPQYQR
jgi:tetratricopeptide (TPR) repeat protein